MPSTEKLVVSTRQSAVLIMEYQPAILASAGAPESVLLPHAREVLAQSREAGIQVIYVRLCFRPGYPEIGAGNKVFSGLRESGLFTGGPEGGIHPLVAPHPEDIIIMKRRVGPFQGTDLDMILRAKKIDTLILFGVSTSGVVLSTVRQASDADYSLIVLQDLCFDHDAEVHGCLMDKVFPRQAKVVAAAEFSQSIRVAD